MSIKKFEYPDDIPNGLDPEKLYASGESSEPRERLRNFLSPIFTYFQILEAEEKVDKDLIKILEGTKEKCITNLPYIRYWLGKIE